MMRHSLAPWLLACVGLVACGLTARDAMADTPSSSTHSAGDQQTPKAIERPSSPDDVRGWSTYLRVVVQQNSEGLTSNTSYLFFVPAGADEQAAGGRQRLAEDLKDLAARRLRPGNLVAFAGPDTAATANTLVDAFISAEPDWAKGTVLLFIGSPADKTRVFDTLRTSGATLRFVNTADLPSVTPVASAVPLPNFIPPRPAPPPPPPTPPGTKPPVSFRFISPGNLPRTRPSSMDITYASQHRPAYPPEAIRAHHEGSVLVLAEINVDGKVTGTRVEQSSGYRELDDSATTTVSGWKFNPAYRDGTPVASVVRVPIGFSLPKAAAKP